MLDTERLILRPWRVSEAGVQRALWAERDPRVPPHRRLGADGRPTLEEFEERIRRGGRLLGAELRSTGDVIGYCGLIGPEDDPELAYEFSQRQWGHGYATEAARAVVEWARASGHTRLRAGVRDWNTASRRVLQKLGFTETGLVETDPVHGDSLLTVLEL